MCPSMKVIERGALIDSWQVAYVWAFIVKFNQKEKIRGLESAEEYVLSPLISLRESQD